MKIINTYNDYILDLLLEQTGGEMIFQLLPRLSKLLKKLNHPIAKRLLDISTTNSEGENKKITYLDIDEDDNGKFTFSQSNKVYGFLKKNDVDPESMKYFINGHQDSNDIKGSIPRVSGKIGKVVTKIFSNEFVPSGKPGEDIESFTNLVKSKLTIDFEKFKVVEGDDIVKYYDVKNYVEYATGSVLGSSCMRYSYCSEYINFYRLNEDKVKLVILFDEDDDTKIRGRALLWTLDEINGENTDRLFMDRIYTTNDFEVDMFKDFAKKNGWLHKDNQNMVAGGYIVDTVADDKRKYQLVVNNIKDEGEGEGEYPYMDTMKYYDIDEGTLSNDSDYGSGTIYTLEDTSGGYEGSEGIYVDYYSDSYNEDELQWCSLGDEYRLVEDAYYVEWEQEFATQDWMDENVVYSDREGEHIDYNTAVHLEHYDEYVSQEYADKNMVYSDLTSDYYDEDDAKRSEYHDTWIHEDSAVEVMTDYYDTDKEDYRSDNDDDSYFIYSYRDEDGDVQVVYYDNSLMKHFVTAVVKIDTVDKDNPFVWNDKYEDAAHSRYYDKIGDKDKLFKWKGHYFNNNLKNDVTGQTKIW